MGSLNKYIIETPHQKRKISNLLATTRKKPANKLDPPEVTDSQIMTPKKTSSALTHGSNGTVVQATTMGSMGAWNLQSCTVQIHHHHHSSPVKKDPKTAEVVLEEAE